MIGGVGQRMLSGVTRKMAGQFFEAVDDDIAGVRPAAIDQPVLTRAAGAPAGSPVFAGRNATPAGDVRSGRREFGFGVLSGGVIALAGVIVGWAIGGR
jgi:hypothetical protein